MSQNGASITIYSDYVCPFCYLGRLSLEEYRETRSDELEIDWHPFDLRSRKRGHDGEIDHSVDDGKDDAYFEEVRKNIARLKTEYDAEEMLGLDDVPRPVDSFDAQLASFFVKTEYPDRWFVFDDAIFEALWIEGQDVGDVDVLAALADDVGLDGDEIRTAIADEDLRDRLREQFSAAQREGITAVPTFAYDEHVARGAVPPEHLRRLVEGP